ncbi:unnamed protein product [Echinostoma caproni]|uniref:Aquaporin n=1 Tax=Echinostoma caproni TaxID=27848 RepID=A0A183B6F9_9TREM|nr:unnamed protein product [Echinostoma caproni]
MGVYITSLLLPRTSASPEHPLGMTIPAEGVSVAAAIVLEMMATFMLELTILVSADAKVPDVEMGERTTIFVGCSFAVMTASVGPLTGCSLNPARSLAPALLAKSFNNQWIYVVGPVAGGILAALVHQAIIHPINPCSRAQNLCPSERE